MRPFSDNSRLMSLVLILLLVAGCEAEQKREYWGSLYFGIGTYLGQLDLRDGSVAVLANLGDTNIREVAGFSDDQLLLSVFGPVNHKNTFRLMQYELDAGGMATVLIGRHGRYLPGPEALIYDDDTHLNARIYGGDGMEEVTVARHRFGAHAQILQAGETQFLYTIGQDETVVSFDIETRESKSLTKLSAQCGLEGALWIANRAALLCKSHKDLHDYAFVGLDGEFQGTLAMPDASLFLAIAYLEDQEALVLTESWKTVVSESTRYAVWTYDLRNGNMDRLVKEQFVGTHVVYSAN